MAARKKSAEIRREVSRDDRAPVANVLTLQRHPLLQIKDEDPSCCDRLEILLRPDGARFAIYNYGDEEGRSHSVHISPADFEAFVECGRAHSFASSDPKDGSAEAWTILEDTLLQIMGEKLDGKSYLEILLRPDGVSFALTACDHEGIFSELTVRVSPAIFKEVVDRCRRHSFAR